MNNFIAIVFLLLGFHQSIGQQLIFEGYVFESGNRGYINDVKLIFSDDAGNRLDSCSTNREGYYRISLPDINAYNISTEKELFETKSLRIPNTSVGKDSNLFIKIELKRNPGYVFEITLANKKEKNATETDALKGTLIEVYNNTLKKEELVLRDYTAPEFKVNLIKGNHYTILIRKPDYLAKRMEAFVDVEGCILCFEGVGTIEPGVSDNLSDNNQMGVLLANVELERIFKGKKLSLNHLYYDFGKWDLKDDSKEELDKVITMMADNHKAKVELGAHTDSRGSNEDNMNLSWLRAKSAVKYLVAHGVSKKRIVAKGYGETELKNNCADGVICTEEEHLKNRRTELKILSLSDDLGDMKSLSEIKREEQMAEMIKEIQFSGQIRVPEGMELKEYLESKEKDDQKIAEPSEATKLVDQIKEEHFSVIKIVIKESPEALSANHELYLRHPQMLQYQDKDGTYLYMVGLFESLEEAQVFLDKTIHLIYPKAYMIRIVDGNILRI